MNSGSDLLQPLGSIGRSEGSRLSHISSKESLSTHPLLSSTSQASHTEAPGHVHDSSTPSPPRYLPYVPRHQRIPTSPPTTQPSLASVPVSKQASASLTVPGSGNVASTATSQLQLQNLKAAAQSIGLNGGSFGWSMLAKVASEGEWEDVWNALTVEKATLLLPAEDISTNDKITPEVLQDHIVFLDLATRASIPVITLSGLKGTLNDSTLIFQSTLPITSKSFQSIRTPSLRIATLASLTLSSKQSNHPKFTVYPNVTMLPLPPRSVKPVLPPRPGIRGVNTPATSTPGSRLPNPFASLFGSRTPTPVPAPTPRPGSPNLETEKTVEISAIAIDRKISTQEIGKQVYKLLTRETRDTLKRNGVPAYVIDHVETFLEPLLPFTKSKRSSNGYSLQDDLILERSAQDISNHFQEFYATLEANIRSTEAPDTSNARRDEVPGSTVAEGRHHEKLVSEGRIREILETVEKTICTVLYDRLFRPDTSDDRQHDEALASRIAALNLLDLSPEHLGLDVGSNGKALDDLIARCGKALSSLEGPDIYSPAQKGSALVTAHHVLVDGLARLPPIQLKPEDDIQRPKQSPKVAPSPWEPDDDGNHSNEITIIDLRSDPSPLDESLERELKPLPLKVGINENPGDSPITLDTLEKDLSNSPEAHPNTLTHVTEPTPVSGDVLLPLIIFSVVKCNPANLVSHLLYVQRYRNHAVGGEESYSLVNLMAVVEFLEHVDLAALGLGDSDRILSAEALSPIPLRHMPLADTESAAQSVPSRLRGRVVQEVDALAGSANKVLTGVVDTSFGVLKSLLSPAVTAINDTAEPQQSASWRAGPSIGLLRRASGFSLSSVAASLPGSHKDKGKNVSPEEGQQLIEVPSRPASLRGGQSDEEDDEDESSDEDGADDDSYDEEMNDYRSDARSVRSFSSMMSSASKEKRKKKRKTITDRLASVPGLSKMANATSRETPSKTSVPSSRRTSMLGPQIYEENQEISRPSRIPPPKKRFLDCTAYDLRLSEVNELLQEYRRVVDALTALDGFEDSH